MYKHFRALGVFFIIYGLWVLVEILIIAFKPHLARATAPRGFWPAFISATLALVGLWLLTGIALLTKRYWGRPLSIVASILALFSIPFGTALGVYGLWTMLSTAGEQSYRSYVQPGRHDQPQTGM